MNPLVSVIIPTKNSERTLRKCIASIQNQSYRHVEIIVVDNHSSDATTAIATSMNTTVLTHGNERSLQRNKGAEKSTGDFLLFVDSDMELSPVVITECVETMEQRATIQAIAIPEQSFGEGFWAKCKTLERSFYVITPWMQGARFFRKSAYARMEGFNISMIAGEDFDAHNRILHIFGNESIQTISSMIFHNEGNPSLAQFMKKKFYYGSNIREYRDKLHNAPLYKKQASIGVRMLLFFSQPARIAEHPVLFFGMIFMKMCEFLAGGAGYVLHARK